MKRYHQLPACTPVEIRVHHVADDRTRTDDGDLHDEVVELRRLEARQRGHLCARLHLEDADGIGPLQQLVDERIVWWEMREVHERLVLSAVHRLRGARAGAIGPRTPGASRRIPR